MTKRTRMLCLVGGLVVFVTGISRIINHQDWTLVIIGFLILAFTISGFFKNRQ